MTDFVFPTNSAVAKELNEFIERGVRLKHEEDVLKSDLKELANDAKEKFDIPTGTFNKYVKASYDKNKFLEDLEALQAISDDLGLED